MSDKTPTGLGREPAPSSPDRTEAVAKALRAANPFAGVTDDEWAWMVQANGFAAVAVAALETDLRERIATDIEAQRHPADWHQGPAVCVHCDRMTVAARIARGGQS